MKFINVAKEIIMILVGCGTSKQELSLVILGVTLWGSHVHLLVHHFQLLSLLLRYVQSH